MRFSKRFAWAESVSHGTIISGPDDWIAPGVTTLTDARDRAARFRYRESSSSTARRRSRSVARKLCPTKAHTKPQPDAAQLRAIERLLKDGKYGEAIRRIRPARRRFPDHGGLHRALVEGLEQEKGPRAAGLAA
jgi:hypothetical protein